MAMAWINYEMVEVVNGYGFYYLKLFQAVNYA